MKPAVLLLCACLGAFGQMNCNPPDGSCQGAEEGACYNYNACPAPNPNVSCSTNCSTCLGFEQNQAGANYTCCSGIVQCTYENAVNQDCQAYNVDWSICWVWYDTQVAEGFFPPPSELANCLNGAYYGYEAAVTGAQAGRDGQQTGCYNSQSNTLDAAQAAYEGCMSGCG